MNGFETQQATVLMNLNKPGNNVSAGKILVRIKITLKPINYYDKFGRYSIAAAFLKW